MSRRVAFELVASPSLGLDGRSRVECRKSVRNDTSFCLVLFIYLVFAASPFCLV